MQSIGHQLILVLISSTLFFTNLGKPRLWDRDEPRNARCAVEMMERGDWTVPTFNGELRTHKPVLLYWLMMSAYSAFGVNEFSARFWSAFLAMGTVQLTYVIGRRLLSPRAAFWSAIILSSTLMFNVAAHAATPDSALIFCVTLSLAIYARTSFGDSASRKWSSFAWLTNRFRATGQSESTLYARSYYPRRLYAIPLYAAMGLGVLAKGPIGIVMPTAVIGLFLAIVRLSDEVSSIRTSENPLLAAAWRILRPLSPLHLFRTAWSMHPFTAVASAMAVALPWYLLVGVETDGKWVQSFLLEHNISRASSAMEGHSGSAFFYYPIAILVGFFPWSILAVPIAIDTGHRLKSENENRIATVFLLCWIGVFVVAFSLAQTKLPSYVTPTYPAIALLAGACLERMLNHTSTVSQFWRKASAGSLATIGVLSIPAIYFATTQFLPDARLLTLIGVIPLLFGIISWKFAASDVRTRFVVPLAVGAYGIVFSIFGFALPRIGNDQQIIELVNPSDQHPQVTFASYAVHEPSWVFYAKRNIPYLPVGEDKKALKLLQHADTAVITTETEYQKIRSQLPLGTQIVRRVDYFMKDEQLVLIGRRHLFANRNNAPTLTTTR